MDSRRPHHLGSRAGSDTRSLAFRNCRQRTAVNHRGKRGIDELTWSPCTPDLRRCGALVDACFASATTPKADAPSAKSASRSSKAAEDIERSRSIRGIIRAAVALLAAAASPISPSGRRRLTRLLRTVELQAPPRRAQPSQGQPQLRPLRCAFRSRLCSRCRRPARRDPPGGVAEGRKLVALTFDLCEQPGEVTGYDGPLSTICAQTMMKTDVSIERQMVSQPRRAGAQLIADPQLEIANHSWQHRGIRASAGADLKQEIEGPQRAYERSAPSSRPAMRSDPPGHRQSRCRSGWACSASRSGPATRTACAPSTMPGCSLSNGTFRLATRRPANRPWPLRARWCARPSPAPSSFLTPTAAAITRRKRCRSPYRN